MVKLPAHWIERLIPRFEGVRVCVTGGAGFIGGHLVDALVSLGANVSVIDDLSNSTAEHLAGLIELEPDRVRFVNASILEDTALGDAVEGCKHVFHLAALGSVPQSIEQPERSFVVNALGTLRVAQAARQAGAARLIYSASSSAYGTNEALPKREDHVPETVSPYAAGKLAGEHLMRTWSECYALSTISLRYFNVFGPRQSADSAYAAVIAAFAKRLLAGEPPVIFGDGRQSRDFTYVSNAVLANLLAAATEKPLRGEAVNIGTGRRVNLLELASVMADLCGAPHLAPVHKPERPGDVRHSLADLTRALEVIGYEPIGKLEPGLKETIAWYRGVLAGA